MEKIVPRANYWKLLTVSLLLWTATALIITFEPAERELHFIPVWVASLIYLCSYLYFFVQYRDAKKSRVKSQEPDSGPRLDRLWLLVMGAISVFVLLTFTIAYALEATSVTLGFLLGIAFFAPIVGLFGTFMTRGNRHFYGKDLFSCLDLADPAEAVSQSELESSWRMHLVWMLSLALLTAASIVFGYHLDNAAPDVWVPGLLYVVGIGILVIAHGVKFFMMGDNTPSWFWWTNSLLILALIATAFIPVPWWIDSSANIEILLIPTYIALAFGIFFGGARWYQTAK